jgi:hypothetical protein
MHFRESERRGNRCKDEPYTGMVLQNWASTYSVEVPLLSTRSDVKKLLSQWRKESGRWHMASKYKTTNLGINQ